MHTVTKFLTTLFALLCITGSALGASYRIDFSGAAVVPGDNFSGYALLDYNVMDSDSAPAQGTYVGLVTYLELQINGVHFVMSSTVSSGDGSVFNDDIFYGDLFSFSVEVESTTDATDSGLFILQLVDTSSTIFDDASLPTDFTLDDFDAFNGGIFSTGVFLPSAGSAVVPLESIHISQVPLPGGLLLLLSGLIPVIGFRYASR